MEGVANVIGGSQRFAVNRQTKNESVNWPWTSVGGVNEDAIADDGSEQCRTMSKTMAWTNYKGDVPVVKALRSVLSWRTIIMVEEWKRLDHKWRSNECLKMETRMEFSQQRRVAKWAGEGDVWVQEWFLHLARKNDVILPCKGRDRARNIYRSK